MSYREKIAWVCLLSTIAVWTPYFAYAPAQSWPGDLGASSVVTAFIAAVVLQTLVGIVSGIVIAVRSGPEPKDERDIAVAARAVKIAYYVLITLGFMAVSFAAFRGMAITQGPAGDRSAVLIMSQVVLLCFVVAEATRFLTQVICYRRGV